MPLDRRFVFRVLTLLLDIRINCAGEGAARRFFGRAAVFQPAGVVVVLLHLQAAREAEARRDFHAVIRQVVAIATTTVGLDEERLGQVIVADFLQNVVLNALGIAEFFLGEAFIAFYQQAERHVRVHNRLAAQRFLEPLDRNVNRCKYFQVRSPFNGSTGTCFVRRLHGERFFLGAYHFTFLEMQLIFVAFAPHGNIHVFGSVLRCTRTQAVRAQGVIVVAALVVVIFSAGIQLAEDKFPVEALFHRVPVKRAAAAVIFHLDGFILENGQRDKVAIPLARLVHRVGKDLKYRVLAAVKAV